MRFFQNDYVGKHTKSKHKDLHAPGRQAPVTIELDKSDNRQSKAVSPPIPQTSTSPVIYESRNIWVP
jgi:hypothetical protein